MVTNLPLDNLQFRIPTDLLQEFRTEPRIVIRHPWVIGIPVPEILLREELFQKIYDAGYEVMLVPREVRR